MKPRTLLVLTLVVVVLAAFILFFERDLPSTDEQRELADRVLPIDSDSVDAVTIESEGQKVRMELVPPQTLAEDAASADGQWRITEPLTARADQDALTSLLEELVALGIDRELGDIELGDVGLAEPVAVASLDADGDTWGVAVGSRVPATDQIIISLSTGRDRDRVLVTSGGFADRLTAKPEDWRSRRVVPADTFEISSLRLSRPEGVVELERRSGRLFEMVAPIRDEADADRVSELLEELVDLEVETFLEGDPSDPDYGLDPPVYSLEVGIDGRQPTILGLGAPVGDGDLRYATAEGQLFTTELPPSSMLDRPASDWQSRGWTSFEPFEVERLRVVEGDSDVELERIDGEWRLAGEAVSYSVARQFLDAVADVRGDGIVAPADHHLQPDSAVTVTIELEASERLEMLTLRQLAGSAALAERSDRSFLLEISEETVATIVSAVEDLVAGLPGSEEVLLPRAG